MYSYDYTHSIMMYSYNYTYCRVECVALGWVWE